MPRKADGTEVGVKTFEETGLQAGGYSCRFDVTIGANPGFKILSTDESGVACYKNPGWQRWKQLFRYGDNLPASEAVYKGDSNPMMAPHAYWVARASSNPDVMIASMYGKAYRTTTGGEPSSPGAGDAWTKITAYKGGVPDATLHHLPHGVARLRGPTCQIDPVNALISLHGNPIDGAYVSNDGCVTLPMISTSQIPAPINSVSPAERWGVNFAFDLSTASGGKTQTVYCSSSGNTIRRSTGGADSGVWTDIGGPTTARDMFAAGGLLWVCTATQEVWRYNGTTWTRMVQGVSNLAGSTVAVRPSNHLHVAILQEGGGIATTTDGGTFTQRTDLFSVGSGKPASFKEMNLDYLAPGMMRWIEEGGTNRWGLTMGVGYVEFDNPPRLNLANKWRADSLGILELVPTALHFTQKANLLIACHDRALWGFEADKLTADPTGHGPDYIIDITHGVDIQSIDTDPDFVLATRYRSASYPGYFKHEGGGVDPNGWVPINPPGAAWLAGNIVPFSRTNYFLVPSDKIGPKVTGDGGASWQNPVFRKTPGGTIVDMSAIGWGSNIIYASRRKILVPIEGEPLGALMFVSGNEAPGDPRTGVWETDDGGFNWVCIKDGHFGAGNSDMFAAKIRRVPGHNDCYFWVAGAADGPIVGGVKQPSGPMMRFTNDRFASNVLLAGFDEVFDVSVGPSYTNAAGERSNPFGWVYVDGWYNGQWRKWISNDFNPASPNSATYEIDVQYPGGRNDFDGVLAANPKRPGQYVIGTPAGGAYRRHMAFKAMAL